MSTQSRSADTPLNRGGLLIATRNRGKLTEFRRLLSELPLDLYGLDDVGVTGEAVEDGLTFAENATIKARYYYHQTGLRTLADDSGLEVEALGGAPGVRSARYAGRHATDRVRVSRLLDALDATGDPLRRARFVCVLALVEAGSDDAHLFSGTCPGCISSRPRGSGGFGYDPVFIPDGHIKTFGELPSEIKNSISHRALALNLLKKYLQDRIATSQGL